MSSRRYIKLKPLQCRLVGRSGKRKLNAMVGTIGKKVPGGIGMGTREAGHGGSVQLLLE